MMWWGFPGGTQDPRIAKIRGSLAVWYDALMGTRLLPGDDRHGTVNGYTNYACRCDLCCQANSEYQNPKARERRQSGLAADDPRHGTDNGYTNYSCRCDRCVRARSDMVSLRRHGVTRSVPDAELTFSDL